MASILPALVGGAITLTIALTAYFYKNRIAYSVVSFGAMPNTNDDIDIKSYGHLFAAQIKIKNFGYRTLEDVELHYPIGKHPFSSKVYNASTLSTSAIKISWSDGVFKMNASRLPPKEQFIVNIFYTGFGSTAEKLSGTGGKYKIVNLEWHELKRRTLAQLLWLAAVGLVLIFSPFIDGALQPAPRTQSQPSQVKELPHP